MLTLTDKCTSRRILQELTLILKDEVLLCPHRILQLIKKETVRSTNHTQWPLPPPSSFSYLSYPPQSSLYHSFPPPISLAARMTYALTELSHGTFPVLQTTPSHH
jgi:hypothetical protein